MKNLKISIFVICCVVLGIGIFVVRNIKYKNISNEILNYLDNKYAKQEFRIKRRKKIMKGGKPFLDLDGASDHTGEITYYYEVESIDENIIFDVHYFDYKGLETSIVDSYEQVKEIYLNKDKILKVINNKLNFDIKDFKIKEWINYSSHNKFSYAVMIDVDEELSKVLDRGYADKVDSIRKEIFFNIFNLEDDEMSNYYFYEEENESKDYYYVVLSFNLNYKDLSLNMSRYNSAVRDLGEEIGGSELYTYLEYK